MTTLTISKMRAELMDTDHDCRNSDPHDSCTTCGHVFEASDKEIKKLYQRLEDLRKEHVQADVDAMLAEDAKEMREYETV